MHVHKGELYARANSRYIQKQEWKLKHTTCDLCVLINSAQPCVQKNHIIKCRTTDIYWTGYYLHASGMWTERLQWKSRVPREGVLLLSFSNWSYSTSLNQIVDENCCSLWQQIDGATLFTKQWMAKGFKIWTQISNWSLNLCQLSAPRSKNLKGLTTSSNSHTWHI